MDNDQEREVKWYKHLFLHKELKQAVLIIAATAIVPRLFSLSLLVKWDIFYNLRVLTTVANGYAPLEIALPAKALAFFVLIAALIKIILDTKRWRGWMLVSILGFLAFYSISLPSKSDVLRAVQNSQPLISSIEAYHEKNGRYPTSLDEISTVPHTGLAPNRQFGYHSRKGNGTVPHRGKNYGTVFIGDEDYVIWIPMVPGGTVIYRPSGDYSDISGKTLTNGWLWTGD